MSIEPERERFQSLLIQHLEGVLSLSEPQVASLYHHYSLLCRWNNVINLSSVSDLETAVVRHYCESLFLAANLPAAPLAVADLGSGAGFPGIPLAVRRPDCEVTLIEAHMRKAVFLKEAARRQSNVEVLCVRAEDLDRRFDWLVSRAVGWKEVLRAAPCLAARVALLVGSRDAEELSRAADGCWGPPMRLPWGNRRQLIFGSLFHVEHDRI